MQSNIFKIAMAPFLVIITGLALWLSLALAFCIPQQAALPHAQESLKIMQSEQNSLEHASLSGRGYYSDFTEYVMLNISIQSCDNPLIGPLESRMTITDQGMGSPDSLKAAITGEAGEEAFYARYWHGYILLIRPLLLFLNIAQIRLLFQVAFFILLSWVAVSLTRLDPEGGGQLAIALTFSFVALGACQASENLPTFPSFFLSVLGCLWIVRSQKRSTLSLASEKTRLFLGFGLIGSLTVFFDFLNNPLLTLTVPLALHISIAREKPLRSTLGTLIVSAVGWVTGYLGLWLMKWLLSTVATGNNIFNDALDTIAFRSGISEEGALSGTPADAILRNFGILDFMGYTLILFLTLALISAALQYGMQHSSHSHNCLF